MFASDAPLVNRSICSRRAPPLYSYRAKRPTFVDAASIWKSDHVPDDISALNLNHMPTDTLPVPVQPILLEVAKYIELFDAPKSGPLLINADATGVEPVLVNAYPLPVASEALPLDSSNFQ